MCFFAPKENVRPARSRKLDVLDLVKGRGGISLVGLRFPARSSWGIGISADDGAVEALLCRDEAVDVALVVPDDPLPLATVSIRPDVAVTEDHSGANSSPKINIRQIPTAHLTYRFVLSPENMLSSASRSEVVDLRRACPLGRLILRPPS